MTAPAHAEAYMEVTATPQEVVLGDHFTLRISVVQSSENLSQDFAVPRLTLPSLPDVDVVNYQNQNYRVQLGGRQKMNTEVVYTLRPKKAGTIQIPVLEQPYQEGNTPTVLRSEAVRIKVLPGGSSSTNSNTLTPSPSASPPDNTPPKPFLQTEPLSTIESGATSFFQRVLQGLFLLGVLLFGMGIGWLWRRRSQPRVPEAGAVPDVPLVPLQRSFPLSHQQLKDHRPEEVLNTFRLELVQNLVSRGFLKAGSEARALSNQEMLKALQKQLVPMPFYEDCQRLLKQDEALRYQGAAITMKTLQTLIDQGERIFRKT